MKLKNELEIIEEELNVYSACEFIEIKENQRLDNYLRVIFLLLDFLVDGHYNDEQHEFFSTKIRDIFNEAKMKYANNDEFLFFGGVMIYVAEWYFGFDNVNEARIMLQDAMKSKPDNIIFKWGFYSITDQRVEVDTQIKQHLSEQILRDDLIIEWLKNKGMLGKYVLGIIQSTYQRTEAP